MTKIVNLLSVAPLLRALMFRALTLAALMLSSALTIGAEVTDLYKASVAVPDRSVAARDSAVAEGLSRVLVRVSGNSSIVLQDSVKSALTDAGRYVVQFGYHSKETLSPEDGAMIKTVFLNVSFDEVAVNQFLRREGFPIWATSRPNILFWGAVSGVGGRQLVGGQQQIALQQALEQQAKRRGLPLVLPKYDDQDLAQVRAGDIWGMFVDPIVSASARYDANVVVIAKVLETPDSVRVSAALSIQEQQQWWEVAAETLDQAVVMLIDQLGDRVGERFAVQASLAVGEQVILDVSGVEELKDYARLGEYLDGLLAIRGWYLSQAQGSHHQYTIILESDLDALEQGLRLDRKLVPQPVKLVVPLGEGSTDAAESTSTSTIPVTEGPAEASTNGLQVPARPVLYYRWNG
ncbi:MAG: DUF2066 domain-containing protein [Ketobacter sp.]|nr:DUF2066 domain-containing protein [Ketobacter sp.]